MLSDRQVIALARIMGGADADLPDLADVLAEFDALLLSGPVAVDRSQLELLQLMGVA